MVVDRPPQKGDTKRTVDTIDVCCWTKRTRRTASGLAPDDGVRVEVSDDSPYLPVLLESRSLSEHGNGLRLVAALATSWGTDPRDDLRPGKRVWFALA